MQLLSLAISMKMPLTRTSCSFYWYACVFAFYTLIGRIKENYSIEIIKDSLADVPIYSK